MCLTTNKRRWCSGNMYASHACAPGSIPGRRKDSLLFCLQVLSGQKLDSDLDFLFF